MKPGDKVTRKWKPSLGVGEVLHILGENIVVNWNPKGISNVSSEKQKHLKFVDKS